MGLQSQTRLRTNTFTFGGSQMALVVKNPPASAGGIKRHGFNPWVRKSPGEGHGHPLQCSYLENPMRSLDFCEHAFLINSPHGKSIPERGVWMMPKLGRYVLHEPSHCCQLDYSQRFTTCPHMVMGFVQFLAHFNPILHSFHKQKFKISWATITLTDEV